MIWLNKPWFTGKAETLFPEGFRDAGAAGDCFFCREVQQSPAHFLRQAGIPAQSLTCVPALSGALRASYSPQMILKRISASTAISTGLAILAPFDIASPVPM